MNKCLGAFAHAISTVPKVLPPLHQRCLLKTYLVRVLAILGDFCGKAEDRTVGRVRRASMGKHPRTGISRKL